jgi:hypothetical protein
MDADERAIYYYIKSLRPNSAPVRDISRRVGSRRKFHYNPDWAGPVLARMVERGILQTDTDGSYRLKPIPRPDMRGKRWASPQFAKILKASRKQFDNLVTPEDEDEQYERL